MSPPIFTGVGAALVTVFDSDQEVDLSATSDLAVQLVELGVAAVVVAGSTGEASALSSDERTALVRAVREAVPGTTLLAGTGAASTRQAIELAVAAADSGADGLLVLSPPGVLDPSSYYGSIAEVSTVPLLAYHYPAASPPGIPAPLLRQLPIDGVKDSSGDAGRLMEELDGFSGWVYTGSANLVLFAGIVGCPGAILAVANTHPELAIQAHQGDVAAQRQLAAAARQSLARRPRSLKESVARRFGISPVCRLEAG